MRIVFISNLSRSSSAGPNYSVPSRIRAQSKIDDVFWVNLTDVRWKEWEENPYFHTSDEIEKLTIDNIESLFPKPDIFVFESFYYVEHVALARELARKGIPYIIVPRGSLTHKALHNHSWLKKKIAHWLYFNNYCKKAWAIQYLTLQEYKDSGDIWNKRHFIIPNGVSVHELETKERDDSFTAVFVGRIDLYHKGLDELLKACCSIKSILIEHRFRLTLYGPVLEDYHKAKNMIGSLGLDGIVQMGGEVLGERKARVLKNADLFVLTSRFEGHPMGLIEALSYGVPALVTPGTNMAEEIESHKAGWVCDVNADSIASQLKLVLDSNDILMRGKNAWNLASRYEWDKLAVDFHQELLKAFQ